MSPKPNRRANNVNLAAGCWTVLLSIQLATIFRDYGTVAGVAAWWVIYWILGLIKRHG